ncbi:NAD-binding protein [Myceligenerans halotolerans]
MVIAKRQQRPHFVVCGDGPLAFRVSFALSTRYQGDVTVILPYAGSQYGARIAALDHVTTVESLRPDADAFRRARLADADAVALLDQDDAGNIETALLVNELKPGVRLVVRFFDDELGTGIADHLPNCDVLSASKIAAPPLVALALGEARHLEVPGIDFVVGKPSQLPGRPMLTLAALRGEESVMLPGDEAGLERRITIGLAPPDPEPTKHTRRPNGRVWYFVRQNLNRYIWYALAVLALVIVAGTTLVSLAEPVHWVTALYRVVLDTLAGADPDEATALGTRGVQVVVTLISVAVIPLLTAALVDAVVRARLAAAVSGPGSPMSGHVVVVGLGDVGTRVLATLLERGIPAVAVNLRDDGSRGIPFAREHGVPVVIGDGRRTDVLKAAQIGTARAVMAMTSDDVANIGISIAAGSVDRDPEDRKLRRVLRLFDEEFARRVRGLIPRSAPRSASALASPAFAASVMGPDVLDTVPFRDRVLLVAEVPMHARSELEYRPARDVDVPGEVRLLAVRRPERGFVTDVYQPAATNPLQHNTHLIVIATRTGLEHLRARTAAPERGDPSTN